MHLNTNKKLGLGSIYICIIVNAALLSNYQKLKRLIHTFLISIHDNLKNVIMISITSL